MLSSFSLANFLPYQLAHISERTSRRLSVQYERSHGISLAEWRVLVNLLQFGTSSVRDIQVYTNLEKSRVSRAVDRLAKSDLVEKSTSAQDARLVEITLTQAGRDLLAEILPSTLQFEQSLLQGLTKDQIKVFFDVVEHFHNVLDNDPEARPRYDKDERQQESK